MANFLLKLIYSLLKNNTKIDNIVNLVQLWKNLNIKVSKKTEQSEFSETRKQKKIQKNQSSRGSILTGGGG